MYLRSQLSVSNAQWCFVEMKYLVFFIHIKELYLTEIRYSFQLHKHDCKIYKQIPY
jgi:hypothetical protein